MSSPAKLTPEEVSKLLEALRKAYPNLDVKMIDKIAKC